MPTRNINSDLNITSDLTVAGEVEFSGLSTASVSPFVVSDDGNLGTRTTAQVLGDIAALPLAGGTMSSGAAINFTVPSSGGNFININHTGNEAWTIGAQSGSGVDDYLDIGISGGTRAMSWHETGRVGIGTTSPQAAFHVAGSIGNTPTGDGVLMGLNNNYGHIQLNGSTGSYIDFSSSGVDRKGRILYNNAGNYMQIQTNGSDKVRITSSGNVGIGTTSPSTKLYVKETGAANTAIFENSGQAYSFAAIKVAESQNNKAVLSFAVGDALASTHIFGEINGIVTNNGGALTGDLYFKTNQGDNMQERMRILANGNVGIGTTSPSQKLDVVGHIEANTANANFRAIDGSVITKLQSQTVGGPSQGVIGTESANNLAIVTSNQTRMFVNTSGNVGIGTTSPTTALTIRKAISSAAYGAQASMIEFKSYFTGYDTETVKSAIYSGVSDTGSLDTRGGYMSFHVNNNGTMGEKLRIDKSGSVGIGTTSPSAKLQVFGTSAAPSVSGTFQGSIFSIKGSSTVFLDMGTTGASGYYAWMQAHDAGTGVNYKLAINPLGGNVGIGTTNPNRLLQINGGHSTTRMRLFYAGSQNDRNAYIDMWASEPGVTYNGSGIGSNINGSPYYGRYVTELGQSYIRFVAGQLHLWTGPASSGTASTALQRLTILSGGNVGIGTTSPDNILHIRKGDTTYSSQVGADTMLFLETTNISNALQFSSSNTGTQYIMFGDDDPNAGWISYKHSDNNLNFRTNGSEKMRITSSGEVGIGTTSPFTNLEVAGSGLDSIIRLYAGGGTANIRTWEMRAVGVAGEGLLFRQVNDANNSYTNRMIIDTDGNVGIGTITPDEKLEVNGNILIDKGDNGNISIKNGSQNVAQLGDLGGGTDGQLALYNNSGAVKLVLNGQANSYLDGGNVGIGTTSPTAKLEVAGSSSDGVLVSGGSNDRNTKLTASGLVYSTTSTGGWATGNYVVKNSDGSTLGQIAGGFGGANTLTYTYYGGTAYNNAAMYILSSNKNVGIGTANPSQLLHVSSSTTNPTGIGLQNSQRYYSVRSNNFSLVFTDETVGSERMRINSSGNVGIGTVTPDSRLDVTGGDITVNTSASGFMNFKYGSLGSETSRGTITTDGIDLRINATADLIFQPTGNVGIGTTSPTSKLDVVGNAKIKASSGDGVLTVENAAGSQSLRIDQNSIRTTTNNNLTFLTNGNSNSLVLSQSTDKVGIGTASPIAKLDINGIEGLPATTGTSQNALLRLTPNAPINGESLDFGMRVSGSDSIGWIQATNFGNLGTNYDIAINPNGGNVGIGTTSPEKNLSIGNAQAEGIQFNYDTTNNYRNQILNYWNSTADSRMDFNIARTSGQTPVTIMSVGYNSNVGIGTTSPSKKLDVNGSFKLGTNAYIEYGAYYPYTITTANTAAVGNLVFSAGLGSTAYESKIELQGTNLAANPAIKLSTAGSAKVTVLNSGNVGIGTTSPTSPLTIKSNSVSSSGSALTIQGNSNTNAIVRIAEKSTDGARLHMYDGGVEKIAFYTDGTDNHISAGNVGIGTTSPASKLQVSTTNAANILTLHRDGSNNGTNTTLNRIQFAQDYNSTQQNWGKIDLDSNSSPYRTDLKFYVKSTSGLEMLGMTVHGTASDGPRVGIGTTSPSTKLDVNGITTSDAFRTDTSNTDYNVISRNSTSTTLWVQAAQSNSIQGIASFRYGSATVNAGTEVCAIRKNSSYFINTKLGVGTNNPATTLDVEGTIKHKVYTVSTLPSASPAGQRAFISDNYYNLQESHGMGVYSGGSNFVPVYSDGTNWRVG